MTTQREGLKEKKLSILGLRAKRLMPFDYLSKEELVEVLRELEEIEQWLHSVLISVTAKAIVQKELAELRRDNDDTERQAKGEQGEAEVSVEGAEG